MRISSKGDYGLRALFDLAQHYGQGWVQSDEIARRQHIPVNYLNQMLIMLRKAELIESQRGPQGGHRLARAPEHITLLDAFEALEGTLIIAEQTRDDDSTYPDAVYVDAVWQQVRDTLATTLQQTTLGDLCERKRQQTGFVMYHI